MGISNCDNVARSDENNGNSHQNGTSCIPKMQIFPNIEYTGTKIRIF